MDVCAFCRKMYSKPYFDFNSCSTSHSNTPLLIHLEQLVGIVIMNNSDLKICECCFDLFNELDNLEVKSKSIKTQLIELYNASNLESLISLKSENGNKSEENIFLETFEEDSNDKHNESNDEKETLKEDVKAEPSVIHFSNENDLKKILCKFEKIEKEDESDEICTDSVDLEDDLSSIQYDMLSDNVVYNPPNKTILKMNKIKRGTRKKQPEDSDGKNHQCPQCPKKWRTATELRTHMVSHSEERPYICEVCGQAYKHKTALDIHVGMHNGINPFTCQYCKKAFTQKGALMRHLPIHTGEKQYQCDLCGRCFTHHTSFNVHQISHSGVKSYKCQVCGLGLISGSHLKRHMRVHTGEKKYSCSYCGRRFAEKYNLASHEKLHSMGSSGSSKKKYRCTICGNTYDRKNKLEEHLTQEHSKAGDLQYVKTEGVF